MNQTRAETDDRITTYEQAAGINPYELADWYAAVGHRPAGPDRSVTDQPIVITATAERTDDHA
ncbi:hypothetical protein [Haloactinomyces albus]|uniref:Uncharacterized protein n=1 Tax=Haloactinomyces albus TaxID=1352928 RepID=A0AAE3ZFU1_9ACTN|nr:hypothetical protein [Haloactinomyces albus]MDR7302234.1 hypothetical protein [Haloactinomyces albus]